MSSFRNMPRGAVMRQTAPLPPRLFAFSLASDIKVPPMTEDSDPFVATLASNTLVHGIALRGNKVHITAPGVYLLNIRMRFDPNGTESVLGFYVGVNGEEFEEIGPSNEDEPTSFSYTQIVEVTRETIIMVYLLNDGEEPVNVVAEQPFTLVRLH